MAAIDAAFRRLLDGAPDLQRRVEILSSIPSVWEATAIALVAEMPELGTPSNKQVASLAGLAPSTARPAHGAASAGRTGRARPLPIAAGRLLAAPNPAGPR
jgi:transposase